MQRASESICLWVFLVLVAATCLARNVVNQAEVNDHLHDVANNTEDSPFYCYNTTILYHGCYYTNEAGNISSSCNDDGNFTYTDCCTNCKPDNGDDAAVHRRRYLDRYVNACSK